jgi:iron complex outermembrane recepter protein
MDDSKRDSAFYVTNQSTGEEELVYMRMDMPGKSNTLGAYIHEEFKLNDKNSLLVKADNYTNHSLAEMTMYMHYPGRPPELPMYLQTWPDIIRNVTGIYAQNTTLFSDVLTMNLSGRIDFNMDFLQSHLTKDQFSVFNVQVSDHYYDLTKGIDLLLQYRLGEPFVVEAETGWSERMPVIGERFGFYLYNAYDGYDYIGNPDLKTEKSFFGRIALMYSNTKLKIKLSPSYNLISDYIMGITNENIPPMNFYTNGTRVYTNVSEAKLYSIDLQAMIAPVKRISVFILTKYTHGQLNTGEPMPLIPPLKNIISLSYENDKWSVQAENETALEQDRININYGESVTPSYTIFNMKGNYHFKLKENEFDCSLGITNIMDTAYYEHLDWGKILRPGRSFNFFLKYSF